MASLDSLVKKKLALVESVPDRLQTEAIKAQAQIWRRIEPILQDMDVDANGNILQNENNIRRIAIISEDLKKVLAGGEYKDAVKTFLNSIEEGAKLTDEIAKNFQEGFKPNEIQKQILNISKQNAINTFFGAGLDSRFTQPFAEQLTSNIAARAQLKDSVNSLKALVLGSDTMDGKLLANIKTTAYTAQAVADRSYSAAVNEQLDIEWYEYLGGEIPTTRPFCEHREGEIFHRNEIQLWGEGKNSGGINDIKDGTWAGRMDGTDSKTIFTFVGGWNCRHYLVPVPDNKVPDTIKERAKAEGFYRNASLNTKKEVEEFVKDSELKQTFYHSTPSKNVSSIKNQGFKDTGEVTLGKFLGKGTYLTDEKKVTEYYNDLIDNPSVVQTKVDIKKPLVFDYDKVLQIAKRNNINKSEANEVYLNTLFKKDKKFENAFNKIYAEQESIRQGIFKKYYQLEEEIRKYAGGTPERIAAVRESSDFYNKNIVGTSDTFYNSIRLAAEKVGYDAFFFKTNTIDNSGGQQIVIFDNKKIKVINDAE
jgi:predicted transposase YbfD/YdcC